MKTHRIDFYQAQTTDGNGMESTLGHPSLLSGQGVKQIGEYTYEIKELSNFQNGRSFTGFIAKYRSADLPHVGTPGDDNEHEIQIDEDEGLIEKNFFMFERINQLLVYQYNKYGTSANTLATYLNSIDNRTIKFAPIPKLDAMNRLMSDTVDAKVIEFAVARPAGPVLINHAFNQSLMNILTSTDGYKLNVKISCQRGEHLGSEGKRLLRDMFPFFGSNLKKAKVSVLEDGDIHAIDLIADRLKSSQQVEMDGKYPRPNNMYAALRNARNEVEGSLNAYFGAS